MTLIGEHCHRLLVHNEEILDELKLILTAGVDLTIEGVPERSAQEKAELTVQIDILIPRLKDIMAVLDYIICVMREQRTHDDDECELFDKAVNYLGYIWRLYGFSPTPKLHYLEAHAPTFFWRYRRFFGEDGIERQHNANNNHSRVVACLKRYDIKILLKERRKAAGELPAVQELKAFAIGSTTFHFSPPVKKMKVEKAEAKSEAKYNSRVSVINGLNDGTYSIPSIPS
jgi:hypothetical protein